MQKTVPTEFGPSGRGERAAPCAPGAATRTRATHPGGPLEAAQTSEGHARASFVWPVRVYYEDTDGGGVVYYANYLRFFERCRTEWIRALGFGQHELAQRDRVQFVVAGAELQFLRSAVLDDELTIDARVAERGASYIVFEQQALRGSELLCRARVKVACIGAHTRRPIRLPAALATALAGSPQAAVADSAP